MKILLLGEYSNVHATLAEGLKTLGHEVLLISNGDFWKNYKRDISLTRSYGPLGSLCYILKLLSILPRLRGYDIVQIINPMFLELKADHILPIYNYLRRHNRHIVMGAFGMDWYWVSECLYHMPLRYSDFNLGSELRHTPDSEKECREWLLTSKEKLNRFVARTASAIVTGLYEYDVCYRPYFPDKTHFIALPIKVGENKYKPYIEGSKIKFFIGINRRRNAYKGTDIMLQALEDVCQRHPDKCEMVKAESIPFSEYQILMNNSDFILDQLYSYTPAMNALLAMEKGIICIGGGEEENYAILGEESLRPIVNVAPSLRSVVEKLEFIITHPEQINRLKFESQQYVAKHHDYLKISKRYESLYQNLLNSK